MDKILLASGSPRRSALLSRAGLPFTQVTPHADETTALPVDAVARVRELAERKVRAVLPGLGSHRWVLGCDTLVEVGGEILGQPRNRVEARQMLETLADRTHSVHTGIALYVASVNATRIAHATTRVRFRSLSDAELSRYLTTEEWRGAAGAYRIQERGETLVERINGSYTNVVGLPLSLLCGILSADHYPFGD